MTAPNSTVAEVSGTATVNVDGAGTTITNVSGGTVNVNAAGTTIESYNGGDVAVGSGRIVSMNDGNSSGVISGDGGVTKDSGGVLTLGGVNTYTGATRVAAGKLVVDGSIASSPVTIKGGGTLGGSGTVGAVTVENGGTLDPGNSPGTLHINGDIGWLGGGNYNWQIYDAAGVAGATNSWDLIYSTGSLHLGLLSDTNRFNINLRTLSGISPDADGAAINFDNTQSYRWTIFTASNGIAGFATNKFNVNIQVINGTAGWANSLGGGLIGVEVLGNNLDLVFDPGTSPTPAPTPAPTPTPTPAGSTFASWAGGALLTPETLALYAVGGASGPTNNDGVPPTTVVSTSHLAIIAIIRTNDTNLTTTGFRAANLAVPGVWSNNGVLVTIPDDQTDSPDGCQRQIFQTDRASESKLFMRLESVLQP